MNARPTTLVALLLMLAAGTTTARAQAGQGDPHIGYVYPAGGKCGTTFRVTVAGQSLRGVTGVHVTGTGVKATLIEQFQPWRPLDGDERAALAERIRNVVRQRWAEMVKDGQVDGALPRAILGALGPGGNRATSKPASQEAAAKLPEHPLLYDLEHKSIREILHAVHMLRSGNKGQRNPQLGATALVEITIARDAEPGPRELRLITRGGLTNPLCFELGTLSEVCELEVDEERLLELLPPEPALALPVVVNGQIMPGDVDTFRFAAKQGQRLTFQVHARQLIPYLADAVPGWFQATLKVSDATGHELAYVDDYRFSPDPVLCYEVPADGEYVAEVCDSIYRGREDFVYRLSIGEEPFITSVFPLGCRVGQSKHVAVAGWNLRSDALQMDGKTHGPGVWLRPLRHGAAVSNMVAYHVSPLRSDKEKEDNNTPATAQAVQPPRIIDGRIDAAGDLDYYSFHGDVGAEVIVEVLARRLHSPLDSLVRLLDAAGTVLAWNDDYEHKTGVLHTDAGELTHSADSYLRAQLPADGTYYVQISDAQSQGGEAYAYRLRIGPPQPDFELRVVPSSINVRGGLATAVRVYASRIDGFDGDVDILLKDAPPGFTLSGARIPAGRDSVRMTLSAPAERRAEPLSLTFEGRAIIAGEVVLRTAVPADDMMQAFLYQHLVPAEEAVVAIVGERRGGPGLRWLDEPPVNVTAGSALTLRVAVPARGRARDVTLELSDPPPGIKLRNLKSTDDGLTFELVAEDTAQVGLADNLIVEAYMDVTPEGRGSAGNKRPAGEKRHVSIGCLPALPFRVVAP